MVDVMRLNEKAIDNDEPVLEFLGDSHCFASIWLILFIPEM